MGTKHLTGTKRATIRDVAALAGVSIGTASRALNGRGRLNEATVRQVVEAAEKLNYQPDVIAQSLRSRSTKTIGMLLSDLSNPFYGAVIRGAEERLREEGFAMIIANTNAESSSERYLLNLFSRRRVDCVIVGPCEGSDDLASQKGETPLIGYDRELGSMESSLFIDHRSAAYNATKNLIDLGHERIALLSSNERTFPGKERLAGHRDALRDCGIEVNERLIRTHKSSMDYVFSEALALLSMNPRPTAFLSLGTRMLAGVLQGVREKGLSIPGDVSIISFGDSDLARLYSPSVSSVTWDMEAVGRLLAELALKRLDPSVQQRLERVTMPTRFLDRGSCAPPKD